MILYIDFETASEADLRVTGVHRYLEDPSTRILCMGYAFADQDPKVWIPDDPFPVDVAQHIDLGGTVVAHNAAFEIAISRLLQFPCRSILPEQAVCTMVLCLSHNLPAKLELAAKALRLENQKDTAGNALSLRMARPRAPGRWWHEEDMGRYQRLQEYCKQDVRVLQELHTRLGTLNKTERIAWVLDQKINQYGIYVDPDETTQLQKTCLESEKALNDEMRQITGNQVTSVNQVQAIASFCGLASVTRQEVKTALEQEQPADIRRVLEIRQAAAKSSTKKLKAIQDRQCRDGRLRGLYQFCGAGTTGRWAGRGVQPQNLPRTDDPVLPDNATNLEEASRALRLLCRGAPKKILVGGDFASIEGRVLAWLARENWVLDVYRTHGRMYEESAARIYTCRADEIQKNDPRRQVGKIAELALGFQGGSGAFTTMAQTVDLHISTSKAAEIVRAWRSSRPKTVSLWHAYERAARAAVCQYERYRVDRVDFIRDRKAPEWLQIRLPSGRYLFYHQPRILDGLTYEGRTSKTGTLQRQSLYGGKLVENVVQALARDILRDAMIRINALHCGQIAMHTHDEVVVETVPGEHGLTEELLRVTMEEALPWAQDLPISVSTWSGIRYGK